MVFIDQSVSARLELAQGERAAHYAAAQARLLPSSATTAVEIGGGRAIFAGPGSFVNRVFALGMQGAVARDALNSIEAFYRARQAVARLDVCPFADPSLLHMVQSRTYDLEQFFNVLVCPLPYTSSSNQPSSDIEVRAIDRGERDLWLRTVAQGFSDSETPPEDVLKVLVPNAASAIGTCFLAWVAGHPAGGGAIYIHDGVAELGSTSTRRQFRGRGVQSALLDRRLAVAYESGCDLAMVITLPGTASQRNVERIGFRLAYTKPVLIGHAS